ncbi:MAG: tyrosine-type recombinase/integrase [Actinomycetota bacterium]
MAEFGGWLIERGFARASVRSHLRATRTVDRDLRRVGVHAASCITRQTLEECVRRSAGKPGILATIRSLGRFLGERGRVSESPRVCNFRDAIAADYAAYVTDVRGLVAATVAGHLGTVSRFLAGLGEGELAFRLSTLSPHDIETFVRTAGQHYGRDTLSHVVANLRSFLRFLGIRGLAPAGLDGHVDSPRTHRRERPPRALPWETVRALLQSIDQRNAIGLRDYTMLLLIATYGLRCSEIAALTLNDVDWRHRRIRVPQRKTASVLFLPLTDEVGTVLERYLRRARSPSPRREVFLRMRAPSGPLRSTAISDAFDRWAKRSGLGIPYEGAHCLRHSYAVNLLRRGTPLKTIGDILGHRLAESTCMYLGLALEDLREVALPVPEIGIEKRAGGES